MATSHFVLARMEVGGYDPCDCEIGEDHALDGELLDDSSPEDEQESLSVEDAADIWRSNGMDEDYMFGYSAEELRNA